MIPETENPREANSVYPGTPGMLRLIWVDTLRRVHNVDFLTRRPTHWLLQSYAPVYIQLTDLNIFTEEFSQPSDVDYVGVRKG